MSVPLVYQTPLIRFLRDKSELYYGQVLELREAVELWLGYIPQTFPHYTRHTVQHSDELVVRASKLLFTDGNPTTPVVDLSAIEAYVLIAAAYLHDAGMVASDSEKQEILRSDAWRDWTSDGGGGAKRWREIQDFREGSVPLDGNVRNFIADYQGRFLVAEFIRKSHHLRAANVISEHQRALGRFAFDDPVLERTIADVCVGHGLRTHELEDAERYPERRDIRGETANVRFLAIMLRLSDLLDMSSDRACPLLMNAACPLPADSFAHWTQYRRIRHQLTAPDEIAITAECQTQMEHRLLQDWCQWIVDEVRNARIVMARAARHGGWKPPRAGFEAPEATIVIRPAPNARYLPSRWTLELDRESVFERLIHDVYQYPYIFVRELVQNALDAMRCQMYAELMAEDADPPESPTQVVTERRNRYVLKVGLEERERENELSGEREKKQVLFVDDCGLGMNRDVIERFLLQVGRSYYTTEEFRRVFKFAPVSRFGVGFLSVFAVSDHVIVETYKPSTDQEGIRLTLNGPRSYLLAERGSRRQTGTRVEVMLREPMASGELTRLLGSWCRRVEFPISVKDLDEVTEIRAEAAADFVYERPDLSEMGARFVVRAFPVDRPGIEGELYVFGRVTREGESWAAWNWAQYQYERSQPQAERPSMVGSVDCIQGIAFGTQSSTTGLRPMSMRLDYRGKGYRPTLSREHRRVGQASGRIDVALASRWQEVLTEHLNGSPFAKDEESWRYKQRLVSLFEFPEFWTVVPGTIAFYQNGRRQLGSLKEVQAQAEITSIVHRSELLRPPWRRLPGSAKPSKRAVPEFSEHSCVLSLDFLESLSDEHRTALFEKRSIREVRWESDGYLAIDWLTGGGVGDGPVGGDGVRPVMFTRLPRRSLVGCEIHRTTGSTYGCLLLNSDHEFVQWLSRVRAACSGKLYGLSVKQYATLVDLVDSPARYQGLELANLEQYLGRWREMEKVPAELMPPENSLSRESFVLIETAAS